METKTAKIVAYCTWIGWLIVLLNDAKEDAGVKQHLNQALICYLIALIPAIGTIVAMVFWVMGLIKAINDDDTPLPVIGNWTIIK